MVVYNAEIVDGLSVANYKHFFNEKCEYFPCHSQVNINCHNIIDAHDFNCLFCYCPLFPYKNCGGKYTMLPNGIKDCSECLIPHDKNNYDLIVKKLSNKLLK